MKAKKQLVFIMTDTTRFDMLGCYGNKDMKTPYLDELANEGVLYEKAYTCQPVCGPARGAIFTGLYPHANGSFTNCVPLWSGVKTVGEYLQPNDIRCGYVGKWHLDGGDYFGNGVCPNGYEDKYWYDMKRYLDELTPEERLLSRKESTSLENGGIKEEFTFAHRCSNRAVNFLEECSEEDFFLTVSYDEPHGPFLCPEPYASMYKDYEMPRSENLYDKLEDKPLLQKLWAGQNLHENKDELKISPQLFLGCNSFVDYEIGRVLEAVKKYAPDAMVIYASDHGDALRSHSLTAKGPSVYEEIAHVPLIIKGGAYCEAPKNTSYKSVTSLIDITPTILDYFDCYIPPVIQGKPMRPIIENPANFDNSCDEKTFRDTVFLEFHRYEIDHDGFGGIQFMRACVTDTHKMSVNLLDEVDELYDSVKDKAEMKNLINDPSYSTIRKDLHKRILDFMNDTRDPYRGYQWKVRPWNKDTEKPDWEVDYCTRQRPAGKGELIQLDYDTGLEIKENIRHKFKANGVAG